MKQFAWPMLLIASDVDEVIIFPIFLCLHHGKVGPEVKRFLCAPMFIIKILH